MIICGAGWQPAHRLLIGALLLQTAAAQDPISVQKPLGTVLIRPYRAPEVPPARLSNSSHLTSLIRAGKLYLSVQDALALAIENNLDLEVDRYGPLLAISAYERAQAGGPVRGVPSASAQVSSVDSGIGVNGSTQSAGLSSGSGSGGGGGGGAASIQQIGAMDCARHRTEVLGLRRGIHLRNHARGLPVAEHLAVRATSDFADRILQLE